MDIISKKAISLLLKNKITKKNAFSIEFPDASKIKEVEECLKQKSWKKIGYSLNAGKKIFLYQTDILGNNINDLISENFESNNKNLENRNENLENKNYNFENNNNSDKKLKKISENFSEFLRNDKNENCVNIKEKILLKEVKSWFIDPFFSQMASKFDEGGYNGLLINNMEKDYNLKFVLYCGNKNNIKKNIDFEIFENEKGNKFDKEKVQNLEIKEKLNLDNNLENEKNIISDNNKKKMIIEELEKDEKKTKKYSEKKILEKTKKKKLDHNIIILKEIKKNLTKINLKKNKKQKYSIIKKLKNFRKLINKVN